MNKVRFNVKQLNNPTPAGLERAAKLFIGIAGLIISWMPTNNIVPHNVQDVVSPLLGLLISIAVFALPFFGIQTDRKTIPTGDVTAMETNTSKRKT